MTENAGLWSVRRVTRLGFLAAAGTALFVFESLIPLPLPFLKIGLANISTVLALLAGGAVDALTVAVLRIIAGSLLTGSFLGPSFVIAFSAGLIAAAGMGGARALSGDLFGPVGLSLIGSSLHVVTQGIVVAGLYVRSDAVLSLLPLLLFTGLVGGLVVGLISVRLLPVLFKQQGSSGGASLRQKYRVTMADKIVIVGVAALVAGSFVAAGGQEASTVIVQVEGRTVGKLDLRNDARLTIAGAQGNLVVETQGGRVRMSSADCPNKICVRTGWRNKGGDVIVCVPNKVVVRIARESVGGAGAVTG